MKSWIIVLRIVGMLLFLVAVVGGLIRVILAPEITSWLDAFDYVLPILGGLVGTAICFGVAAGLEAILGLDEKLSALADRSASAELATVAPEVSAPRPSRVKVLRERLVRRLPRLPRLPRFVWPRRLVPFFPIIRSATAAVLTLIAIILMVISGIWFQPVPGVETPVSDAVLAALVGGVVLLAAMFLSKRKVEARQAAEQPLSSGRINLVLLIPGLLLLALGTEMSANLLDSDLLATVSADVQFVTLFTGLVLFAAGMIGAGRRSRLRLRFSRAEILPILAVFLLGFAVRAYQVDTLIHVPVDEGHFALGVYDFYFNHWTTHLLTTVSGFLPATMIYSYWNLLTSQLWGRDLLGLRMANVILGSLTVLATYGVGRALFNRRIGLLCALIMATFPAHVFFSRVSMGQISDPFFAALAVMFAARGFHRNRRADWVMMGVCLGLSQYFFEGGRLLFPPVFIAWIILIALVLRGKFKPLRRGVFLAFFTMVVVITPMYFTMWATHSPFTTRANASGMDMRIFERAFRGEMDEVESADLIRHVTDAFLVYTYNDHHDMFDLYGGVEPLVLHICVPLFLLGLFHALWRFRSVTPLLVIIVFGMSAGNIFLQSPLEFQHYVDVLPTLAILVGIGLGCTLPMLNPFPLRETDPASFSVRRRRWVAAGAAAGAVVTFGLGAAFSAVQIDYFFGHLVPEFNLSYRQVLSFRDVVDAGFRYAEQPNAVHEQMIAFDNAYAVINMASNILDYSIGPLDYPAEMHDSSTITLFTLDALPRDRTYVFFVSPTDTRMIDFLHKSFTLDPPMYSPWPTPLVNHLYIQFTAPQAKNTVAPSRRVRGKLLP